MIGFYNDDIEMPRIDARLIKKWIGAVAESYGRKVGNLNYCFCSDKKILEVNLQFLGHDYYTDIITFDYSDTRTVNGDMYISLDTVRTNSVKFKTEYERELKRVIIHGVLHLCGIDDKGHGMRAVMESAENKALDLLDSKTVI